MFQYLSPIRCHCSSRRRESKLQCFCRNMKLLSNSSPEYQLMDLNRHSVTSYLNDETTRAAINNKMFKRLAPIGGELHEVGLAKSEIEHTGPITVGFFILQYAGLRMLELYYNFILQRFEILTSMRR